MWCAYQQVWGAWLTGAVYVSRIGNTERVPFGDPNRDSLSQVVMRVMDRWSEINRERMHKNVKNDDKDKMV